MLLNQPENQYRHGRSINLQNLTHTTPKTVRMVLAPHMEAINLINLGKLVAEEGLETPDTRIMMLMLAKSCFHFQ